MGVFPFPVPFTGPPMFGSFNPSKLFASNEPGGWYDPSDLTTMFQDAAGTTAAALEQPVGLVLDKSKGLTLGAELVTTPYSGAVSGLWNISASSVTRNGSTSGQAAFTVGSMTAGMFYAVSFTVSNFSGDSIAVRVGASGIARQITGNGTFTLRDVPSGSLTTIIFTAWGGPTGEATITNISVRELPGNHLSQSTSTARPVLSARVNLLLNTATLATQSVTTVATTYTLAFSGAGSITLSGTATGTYSAGSNSITCTAGTLTLTVSGTVTNADLRPANAGVGLPAYQRVTTSTDYDASGFPYYLKFDGTDDFLVSGTIDPGSVDKAQVFAGVRKLSDAAISAIVETSTNASSTAGSLVVYSSVGAAGNFAFGLNGSSWGFGQANGFTAPLTNVLAAAFDIGGVSDTDEVAGRINSTAQSLVFSGDPGGTGNFTSQPVYVGSRAGTSLRFNGSLYSLIVRFSATNMDAATISSTETWVNQKTLAY